MYFVLYFYLSLILNTHNMKKVTVEFLESIAAKDGGYGNLSQLSKDVFKFREYNLLPGTNPHGLDGHYVFAVNITNFNYVYWKDSDYGGLTWVRDNPNKVFIPVHKSVKKQIESLIARRLLISYWYDGNHINHQGPHLFGNNDWWKGCVIETWHITEPNSPLGKLKKMEKQAVKVLQL